MSAETDLVIFFAHYLHALWEKKGYPNVEIRANVLADLNHRGRQNLIDPLLDLAQVKRTFIVDKISLPLEDCPVHNKQ